MIYDDVKHTLVFGEKFNSPLVIFPPFVQTIIFEDDCFKCKYNNKIRKYQLPDSLTRLILGNSFNQGMEVDVLPQSLKYLTFGDGFNQMIKVNVLPQSLTHLTFGHDFNQEINLNVLPHELTHLRFGFEFSQRLVKGVLPQSLIYLHFGHNFNKNIDDGILPSSLIYLNIGNYFIKGLSLNTLPQTLISLHMHCEYFHKSFYESINSLPNLKYLELLGNIDYVNIPQHINKIGFEKLQVKQTNLPPNLKKIKLNNYDTTYSFNYYLQQMPFECKIVGRDNLEIF
jgi:hypothetical protein